MTFAHWIEGTRSFSAERQGFSVTKAQTIPGAKPNKFRISRIKSNTSPKQAKLQTKETVWVTDKLQPWVFACPRPSPKRIERKDVFFRPGAGPGSQTCTP